MPTSEAVSHASRWPKVALLVASTAASFLAVEGAVRLRQWIRYGSAGTTLYTTVRDPASGLPVPLAGQATRTIRINALGFRGPEISPAKPSGVVRVAFIGASTTFCAEVSSNSAAWPNLVWEAMRSRWPARGFDYVNAAYPGYTTGLSLRAVVDRVAPLDPDVIVIYEGINDLSRDTRQQAENQGIVRGAIDDEAGPLSKHFLTFSILRKNFQVMARQRTSPRARKIDLRLEKLTEVFARNYDGLVRAAQRVAPVVAVATLSQKVRPDQPPAAQRANAITHLYYMPYMSVHDIIESYAAYNEVIRRVAAARGAVLIEEEDSIPADDLHFRDSVHFSDEGSRKMAARVIHALLASPELQGLGAGKR